MKPQKPFLWAMILSIVLAFAGIGYLGWFTRYYADDFCVASILHRDGFWGSIANWYNNWTGRYMFAIAADLVSSLGIKAASILPAVSIAFLFLLLAWAFLPIARKANWQYPLLVSLLGSGTINLVLLSTTPNLFQSFLWQDGQVNYCYPLLISCLLGGILIRAWLKPAWPTAAYAGLVFLLVMIGGGLAETYSTTQIGFTAIGFGAVLLFSSRENRSRLLWIFGAAALGSLIAFLIVYIAPGNAGRQSLVGEPPSLPKMIPLSFNGAYHIFRDFIIANRYWALFSLLIPALAGWWVDSSTKKERIQLSARVLWNQAWFRGLVLLPIIIILVVTAACAPTAYTLGVYLEPRSVAVPLFYLVTAFVCLGALMGTGFHRIGLLPDPSSRSYIAWGLPVLILAGVLVGSGTSIQKTVKQIPEYQYYTASWDKRHDFLVEAARQGKSDVTVNGLNARFEVGDLRTESTYWINRCMADYYGLRNINGK